MTINFIPNDPAVPQMQIRATAAAPNRAAGKVRFVAGALPPERRYPPGTAQFLNWQCRQAAFTTLDIFEGICGPLPGWTGDSAVRNMPVITDFGQEINAYYTRADLRFYHYPVGGGIVYSGASTDVVAHEAGHAILDALRPDLWGAQMIEPAAFHEGFGDCIAVMRALADKPTRDALLAGGASISRRNFVESTAEELSAAIAAIYPGHNAALPRRAFNRFQWVLPQTLPTNGGPGVLINEAHSLGQFVSGVYYDLIANIFAAGAGSGQAALWTACQKATRLIVAAARQAPIRPRFFETWGRAMMTIDQTSFGGAYAAHISGAFANHGITVGTTGFLTPQMTVAGTALKASAAGASMLSTTAKRTLRGVLGVAPRTALTMRRVDYGAQAVAEVAALQPVDLTGLADRLAGVHSNVPRPAMVGEVGGGLALLGAVQTDTLYSSEVRDFVATLVARSAIGFDGAAPLQPGQPAGTGFAGLKDAITHVVTKQGSGKVLSRVAFSCGCGHRHAPAGA